MSESLVATIAEHVKADIQDNAVVDVSKLAKTINLQFPNADIQAIADVVPRAVVESRGCAFWDGQTLKHYEQYDGRSSLRGTASRSVPKGPAALPSSSLVIALRSTSTGAPC